MNGENFQHERIGLVDRLWEIECLHLLGFLTPDEYRRALSAAYGAPADVQPVEIGHHGEVCCG